MWFFKTMFAIEFAVYIHVYSIYLFKCIFLRKKDFKINLMYVCNPMRHDEKYLLINQGFAGKQRLMPFFNRQNNDDLILAIQTAGVVRGRNGFRKDKDY